MDGFENEKLEKATDTTRFELKDGEFGGGSAGARYVATALDDTSIRFGPRNKGTKLFRLEARVKRRLDRHHPTVAETRQTSERNFLQDGTLT